MPRRTRPSRERPSWSRKGGSRKPTSRPSWRSPIPRRGPRPVRCWAPSAFSRTGSREGAELLQEAIRLEPRLLGAHLNLAQVYTLQGKDELALPLFRRVLELDPKNAAARMALARSETEKGNYKRSLELAKPALAAFKQSPEGLLILATDFLKTGDRSVRRRARRATRGVCGRVPPPGPSSFAELLVKDGLVAEGIDVLERARTADPSSYELAFALGGAYLVKGDPARALEAYDLALGLKPASVTALRQAAAVAERQGELERSLSYWMRAKKLARGRSGDPPGVRPRLPQDGPPGRRRARAHPGRQPAPGRARLSVHPGRREGRQAPVRGGPGAARAAGRRSGRTMRSFSTRWGPCSTCRGTWRRRRRGSGRAFGWTPEQLASPYYLALVARDQGRDAEAIERLEELLRRYPDHASSCEALGGLLMNDRRYAEAERLLRRAIELNPKSVKANYQLGLLLARTGRREEADKQLELAKSLREEDDATSRLQLRLLDPDG